jgi:hypothetical protein
MDARTINALSLDTVEAALELGELPALDAAHRTTQLKELERKLRRFDDALIVAMTRSIVPSDPRVQRPHSPNPGLAHTAVHSNRPSTVEYPQVYPPFVNYQANQYAPDPRASIPQFQSVPPARLASPRRASPPKKVSEVGQIMNQIPWHTITNLQETHDPSVLESAASVLAKAKAKLMNVESEAEVVQQAEAADIINTWLKKISVWRDPRNVKLSGSPGGLKNVQGVHCYANAIIQTLFYLPSFRGLIADPSLVARRDDVRDGIKKVFEHIAMRDPRASTISNCYRQAYSRRCARLDYGAYPISIY